MSQAPVWKRAFDRWSDDETDELIKAWAPLYIARRRGTKDASVPLHIRGRARSSGALVTEDWRRVAFMVNTYRGIEAGRDSCRTHVQCKDRIETLRKRYVNGKAGRFFSDLHAVWAGEVAGCAAGLAECRGAPAGDAGGTAAAGAYDGAAAAEGGLGGSAAGNAVNRTAAVDGLGPSGNARGIAMVDARASAAAATAEGFVPAGDASRGSAVEAPDGALLIEGAAAAGVAGGTASVAARGGAFVHEDCRAAAFAVNSSRAADRVSSERAHKQCRGRRVKPLSYIYEKKHDAVSDAAMGEERGGASVDGHGAAAAEAARRRATFEPPPISKKPRSAKPAASSANMAADDVEARSSEPAEATLPDLSAHALAAGFVDAAVVMNLAETYKKLRMKMLDVEREKAAAAHAGAARRRRA